MSLRPVKQIIQPKPTIEGAGVKLQRAFGFGKTKDFDPFLLLDDLRNDNPGRLCRRISLAPAPWHRDDNPMYSQARSNTLIAWATGAR
jgi:quercetin 2,3-dioxygenase